MPPKPRKSEVCLGQTCFNTIQVSFLTTSAAAREAEWQERQERKKLKQSKNRGEDHDPSDEERKAPLAIEAPPPGPPSDYKPFAGQIVDGRPVVDSSAMAGYNTEV